MNISVTIVTKNRAESLVCGLKSLVDQTFSHKDFEVIVADNGSIDHTKQVTENFASKFANFRYIFDPRPGQLVGWHRALSLAKGDITCFIDDDIRPCRTWLDSLADAYKDKTVGMVTGPIELSFETDEPNWLDHMKLGEIGGRTLPFLGQLNCGLEIREIPSNFVWGSNFSIRKFLLKEAGGFHPGAMPRELLHYYGDGEIHVGQYVVDQGYKVIYHPGAQVFHYISKNRLSLNAVELKFETSAYARSFQTLRKFGGTYPLPSKQEIVSIADRYFRNPPSTPGNLRVAVINGLTTGFNRHLSCFKSDLEFKLWVLRDNYLDLDAAYENPSLAAYGFIDPSKLDWRHGKNR